jgi:uncharacterized 2Fe-2S/4Fe-4S cluster protein (DUF4445 family)
VIMVSDRATRTNVAVTVDGRSGTAEIGTTLFDFAESLGITVPTSCYKQGKCRECLLEIESGSELLSPLAPQESHLGGKFRLACRTQLTAPGEVHCHTLRRGTLRIETETTGLELDHHIDPAVTRDGSGILLDGKQIAESKSPIHGIAIDIGTTTVVLRLYNLENGHLVATHSFENPQRFGGSDIMARIRFDGEYPNKLLQRTLLGYLTRAIESLPVEVNTIYEIVIAGNPTMRDLFFGLNVQTIGVIPYWSLTETAFREGRANTTSLSMEAKRLRFPIHPEARIYGLPLIASHVGADAAACLLATGIAERDEICAILDIGTNTEALIGNRHRIMAASCPAGPAFEGGGVTFGMPALNGAIERVHINKEGNVETKVIGEAVPVGICGSGLVDLLSELRRTDRMNGQGRLDHASEFIVDPIHHLTVSEADINELAQAKGANAAGLKVLAESYGISLQQIDRLYLAGGFSRHLDVDAACRIGLVPDLPRERIQKIGNAALQGAAMALLSKTRRQQLEELVKRIEHVRLETHSQFFDFFVEGCQFEPFGDAA